MSTSPPPTFLTAAGERQTPYDVAAGEQRMWGAVILRAIADAAWVDAEPNGKPTEKISFLGWMTQRNTANRLRDEAAFWLSLDNVGFREVCANAGLDPVSVRRWAAKAMEASDDDKARWAAADISLHDMREAGELRD